MKIKCIENRVSSIPEEISDRYGSALIAPLVIGKEYIVYTLREDWDGLWFCILDELYSSPMWHPQYFFKIEDQRLSRWWIANYWVDEKNAKRLILGFPECANDKYFLGEVFEGEEEACIIFHRYEKLMNLEFPDSSIKIASQIGDDKWLICPSCMDAWESNDEKDALVICPSCQTIQNNPRYKNVFPSYQT